MCTNAVNIMCKHFVENTDMHETARRLFEAIQTISKGQVDGFASPGAVGAYIGVAPAVITNWKKRGISKDGRLDVNAKHGINPYWLETGEGEMLSGAAANTIDVEATDVTNRRALPGATAQAEAPSPTEHLSALVAVFAAAPESTRDTVAMLAAGAIKNPATLADCVHAIEALAKYSAAKSGPPTESKQFQPPTPNAVTHHHAIEPDTHHPGA